jgi:hypothetical protein
MAATHSDISVQLKWGCFLGTSGFQRRETLSGYTTSWNANYATTLMTLARPERDSLKTSITCPSCGRTRNRENLSFFWDNVGPCVALHAG